MYDLKAIKEGDIYWIQARTEKCADLFQVTEGMLKLLADSLHIALQQGVGASGPGLSYRIDCESGNSFILYIGPGIHYHGYCLSKSKLTAFRNQLIGVLNG